MTYTYTLTDVADETVRKQIAAPLVAYNDRNGGPSGNRLQSVEWEFPVLIAPSSPAQ